MVRLTRAESQARTREQLVETAEQMTRAMPNCRLVTVPDAGHSIPLDNPGGFIDAVRPFLAGG